MSHPSVRVAAQAKINLTLRVFGPDASGYHPIETLFQRLDLHDIVTVTATDGGRTLDVGGPTMPPEGLGPTEQNLAWRAAEVYAQTTGWPRGWHIDIGKLIPVGGGLGGGSADAGAVLRALNALAPSPLSSAELQRLATPLGADVAFLTGDDVLAIGRGYGEQLESLPPLPLADVVLVCSHEGVNTKQAYGWLDADRRGSPEVAPLGLNRRGVESWDDVRLLALNDFEGPVLSRRPELGALLGLLQQTTEDPVLERAFARMSGSGATLFLLTPLDGEGEQPVPDFVISPDDGSTDAPRIVHALTATRVEPVVRLS